MTKERRERRGIKISVQVEPPNPLEQSETVDLAEGVVFQHVKKEYKRLKGCGCRPCGITARDLLDWAIPKSIIK